MAQGKKVVAIDIGGTKIASALVTLEEGAKPVVEFYDKIPTEAKKGGQQVLANAIKILNDVHAHALGEARWGAGRDSSSCLVVAVGTCIGGAFVERGSIMLGAHNEAGHIGHVSCTDAAGVPCQCGATGHLETIACGPGIINRYLELGGDPKDEDGNAVDGAVIDRRAAAGEKAAIDAEARSGHAIGEVLGSLVNMLDPDCIILSGSVAQCGPAWHDAMAAGWSEAVMPPCAKTPIVSGNLGGDAPLIGAAENIVKSAYVEFE